MRNSTTLSMNWLWELNKSTCTAHIHPGARDSALCAICLMGKDERDELDPTPPSPAGLVPQVIMFETMLSVRPIRYAPRHRNIIINKLVSALAGTAKLNFGITLAEIEANETRKQSVCVINNCTEIQ